MGWKSSPIFGVKIKKNKFHHLDSVADNVPLSSVSAARKSSSNFPEREKKNAIEKRETPQDRKVIHVGNDSHVGVAGVV